LGLAILNAIINNESGDYACAYANIEDALAQGSLEQKSLAQTKTA
jgi:hypothetical protein